MLPTHITSRRFATLELFPEVMSTWSTKAWFDYRRWSLMNGVEYFALVQPDTPACVSRDFRECGNITANSTQLGRGMRHALEHTERLHMGT